MSPDDPPERMLLTDMPPRRGGVDRDRVARRTMLEDQTT
jgi:hypothetical protein